nr:hypothetical protein [Sinorhizobium psoraleae]
MPPHLPGLFAGNTANDLFQPCLPRRRQDILRQIKPLDEGELCRHAKNVVERCLSSITSHRVEAGQTVRIGDGSFQQYDGAFRQTSAGLGHQVIEIPLPLRTHQTFQFFRRRAIYAPVPAPEENLIQHCASRLPGRAQLGSNP